MTCEMRELGIVKIAAPCPADWHAMTGDDNVRHCASCKLNVYDLSSLTADEARLLFKTTEGRLCVRFWARADGTVITRDCPQGIRRRKNRRVISVLTALNLAIGALAALLTRKPAPALTAAPVTEPRKHMGMMQFDSTRY